MLTAILAAAGYTLTPPGTPETGTYYRLRHHTGRIFFLSPETISDPSVVLLLVLCTRPGWA